MSMLGSQIKELHEKADMLDGLEGMDNLVRMLREAADTIESLRDKLQELQGVGGESRYTALFGTPERAAQTMMKIFAMCNKPTIYCAKCPLSKAPACYGNDDGDYDAFLEWMRGDS